MHIHRQFTIEDRQFGMILVWQEITIQLVARSTYHLYRSISHDTFLYRTYRRNIWRTADVASAIITVSHIERTLLDFPHHEFALREVFIIPSLCIVESMRHHDTAAVDALPQADGERITFVTLIERFGAPHQFLRRKANQTAMSRQCRQRIAKAEAVGQEDVGALGIEFLAIKSLTKQHISQERFRRTDDSLVSIPTTTSNMPTAIGNIAFHFFILQWIVFLHPCIFHATFKVENIVGIFLEQKEILVQCVSDMVADSSLHVPVPLRVEMCVSHHVGFHCFLLGMNTQCKEY